jgi:hypothetical protein
MKSVQWELTDGRGDRHTDRQTDMTELVVAFRNFVNLPKKDSQKKIVIYIGIRLWIKCIYYYVTR